MPSLNNELTIGDKIVLHLFNFVNAGNCAYLMPYSVTQDGIANNIGISRAHASVELKKLYDKGLVSFVLAHTKGSRCKRKCYCLEPSGINYANKLKVFAVENHIDVEIRSAKDGTDPIIDNLNLDKANTELERASIALNSMRNESSILDIRDALDHVAQAIRYLSQEVM